MSSYIGTIVWRHHPAQTVEFAARDRADALQQLRAWARAEYGPDADRRSYRVRLAPLGGGETSRLQF
jgi:hypothetical protein